jgi:3-methyl-2-oxobutanoate hydroxymethyltransferase
MVDITSARTSVAAEVPAPYGPGPTTRSSPTSDAAGKPVGRIRTHLQQAKDHGKHFAMPEFFKLNGTNGS